MKRDARQHGPGAADDRAGGWGGRRVERVLDHQQFNRWLRQSLRKAVERGPVEALHA
jgi:hypothetical protein